MTFIYIPNFVEDPNTVFDKLYNELNWVKNGVTPRREYYCNDTNAPYTYGSKEFPKTYYPDVYHPEIIKIRKKLEFELNTLLDVCFLNCYEDNKDHLGWHADDSPEMDHNRPIITISLGAERKIFFKERSIEGITDNTPKKSVSLLLGNGSACVMPAGMQKTHLHKIPKHDCPCGPRISLTFRGFVK